MIKQIFLKHQFDDAAGHIEDLIREKLKKNIIVKKLSKQKARPDRIIV